MFGFMKRAHAETIVSLRLDVVRKHLENICGPISDQIWGEHYILGYLAGAFHLLLKVENPPNTKPEYNGLQSSRLWQRFTGRPAQQFLRDTFVLVDNQDPEFLNGFDRGSLWAGMASGIAKREHPMWLVWSKKQRKGVLAMKRCTVNLVT